MSLLFNLAIQYNTPTILTHKYDFALPKAGEFEIIVILAKGKKIANISMDHNKYPYSLAPLSLYSKQLHPPGVYMTELDWR